MEHRSRPYMLSKLTELESGNARLARHIKAHLEAQEQQ